jgi:N-acetylneuraminic acid mutarotase
LYIYGGYDNNSPGIFSDMYAYSFKDGSWRGIEQDGDLPGQRHSHTAVTYGDALFMFGGMTNAMNNTNFLHRFDFNMS